jgi:1,4-dihydroxy-2-naphthoate octaprenyltransferase
MKTEAASLDDVTPGVVQIWVLAARPRTLWAGVAPVVMGVAWALADQAFQWGPALAAAVGAMLIQIGTNFCNDYADFKKGADTSERVGPLRATQAGWVTPRSMLRATVLVFGMAALVGLYLVVRGGWPMFWIALLSIVSGVAYTAGPYALAYRGLGDVFVLIFFGPVAVAGTYYVQALEWSGPVFISGLAPGLLSCAILAVNNLRDVEQDRQAGKRTVAVRFGPGFARAEYVVCLALALLGVPAWLWWTGPVSGTIWLTALTLLVALPPLRLILGGAMGAALNPALGQTARALLAFAVLFTLALLSGML